MLVNANQKLFDIIVQDILNSHNRYNGTCVTDISLLSEEEIINAIENSNDIMINLLGEEFEGEYNINLL